MFMIHMGQFIVKYTFNQNIYPHEKKCKFFTGTACGASDKFQIFVCHVCLFVLFPQGLTFSKILGKLAQT